MVRSLKAKDVDLETGKCIGTGLYTAFVAFGNSSKLSINSCLILLLYRIGTSFQPGKASVRRLEKPLKPGFGVKIGVEDMKERCEGVS